MKKTILLLVLISALNVQSQQYYKVVRYVETPGGTWIRVNSTVTNCFVERFYPATENADAKKPDTKARKDHLKLVIKELRNRDSIYFVPQKRGILPKYYVDTQDEKN